METAEIRRRWLAFFESRGHTVVPSAPLLYDDPTLLFVNAGMVPFKPYFLGQQTPPYPRATSVQKCVRTGDIEEVGKTSRHLTFFQMNGNFSFGDYFKKGAIELAWELLTSAQSEGGYGMEADRLWVTVYQDDDEAAQLWVEHTGVPAERVVRRGMKDNFWSMGVPGPCGPCSEIYYDRGPAYGPEGGPAVDEDRYLEVWNLVFMQNIRGEGGAKEGYEILGDLPAKNVDTGMGLERMATVLQGVDSLYDIDEVRPVIDAAAGLTGKSYGTHSGPAATASHPDDVLLRVVADHVRSSLMLIGDGVVPGNEGRGYVLRRMLRRAVRSMRLLGYDDPALPHLLPVSMDKMSLSYPQLRTDFTRISAIAYAEEEAFRRTLASGITRFEAAIGDSAALTAEVRVDLTHDGVSTQPPQPPAARRLSGAEAFELHDTYGFPIDLTLEMAAEQGVAVDEEGFRRLMQQQRDRAKADAKAKKTGHWDTTAYREVADALGRDVEFTGYDELRSEARVAGLIREGASVRSAGPGEQVELVLDRTPFYAEGGGQLADGGRIELTGGAVVEVHDVQAPITGLSVHRAVVVSGQVEVGEGAHAVVDIARRRAISRAHTATHMVHKAIREALGETATQAGSENGPGRFRFDFNSQQAVPLTQLRDIEAYVNRVLLDDLPVHAQVMTQQQARDMGAMALFGEKYGDAVRVVSVGEWAHELCGGTHTARTTQLGVVKLLGEASIGSGVRRVEALVGADAYTFLAREHAIVGQLTDVLKGRPEELPEKVHGILARLKEAEREIAAARQVHILAVAPQLVSGARDIGPVRLVTHDAGEGVAADDLRTLVLEVRSRLGNDRPAVVAMTAASSGKPAVIVATNDSARAAGVKAGALVRLAAPVLGGGGGGKDDLAQGGGSDVTRMGPALGAIEDYLRTQG